MSRVVESAEEKAKLQARYYQQQLFERAKAENVIACIDTGSGKTLIAAMLLEHVHALQRAERAETANWNETPKRPKISLFVVNLVPLVHQQAAFLDTNTSLKIKFLYGEITTESLSQHHWDKVTQSDTAVIVCTGRIALDAIMHGYLSLSEDVNLLIFDEAHNALGNNDYARLMAHYQLIEPKLRPKIFGMTASPLSSKGSLESALVNLESIFNAKVFSVSVEARAELEAAVHKPEELVVEYDQPTVPLVDHNRPPQIQATITRRMKPSEEFDKILERMIFYWGEYGSILSDLAWLTSKKELRHRAVKKEFLAQQNPRDILVNPEIGKAQERMQVAASVSRQIVAILDTIDLPDIVTLTEHNSSPKLRKVIETLECFRSHAEHFCGIIFCSRRITALALTLLICKTPSLSFLHPEALVGHGGKGDISHSDGMSWDEQKAILSRLRNRDPTNLVIATSVLEEGLDIAPVNCVIRFDLPDHHIGFVQSKGRARAPLSTFILFAEKGNGNHLALLERFAYAEHNIKDFLNSLPADRVAGSVSKTIADHVEDDEDDFDKVINSQSLVDEHTGARLWPVDAPVVLAHYVSLLKADDFCPGGPDYEIVGDEHAWSVTVRLPASSPGGTITGPVMRSKLGARRAAAFNACQLLHQIGELDEHLAPRKKQKHFVQPQAPLTGDYTGVGVEADWAPENTLSFKPALPQIFEEPGIPRITEGLELYWHRFPLPGTNCMGETMRPVALVTAKPLPENLPGVALTEFREQFNVEAEPIGRAHSCALSQENLTKARSYTLKLLQLVTHRTFLCDGMPYLILPLNQSESGIDWEEICQGLQPLKRLLASNAPYSGTFADCLLFDGKDVLAGACPHRSKAVDFDLSPLSIRPAKPHAGDKPLTFLEHRASSRRKSQDFDLEKFKQQPMLIARKLARRIENFLTTAKKKANSETKDSYLIPEFTWLESIRASMYESASLLPSVMHAFQQLLIGHEVNSKVLRNLVDPRNMVVALTHTTAQYPFSYERYEFLGDVFLKAIASAYVFVAFLEYAEGDLHWERREIVNNVNLIAKTKHLDLGSRICTFTFTRKTWRPPLCDIEERPINPKEELQHLGHKSIADVVESIVGAAILTGTDIEKIQQDPDQLWQNIDVGLKALCGFGVLPSEYDSVELIADAWNRSIAFKAVAERWDKRLHLEALYRFQELIGYEFKHPHLALEALTHPGHLRSTLPSYQRLEFLGDALLDFCIDSWLFSTYPELQEGELTSLKDVAVANRTLCGLCEYLRLYKFLQYDRHTSFAQVMTDLIQDMQVARREVDQHFQYPPLDLDRRYGVEDLSAQGSGVSEQENPVLPRESVPYRQYWATKKEIKAIADIVESTLGAVFVDSGFSFETVWKFWRRLYLPWYSRYADYPALLEARDAGVAIRQRPAMAPLCLPPHKMRFD
ncbi:unnamed protein product [Sympodiomycopsis kandeliae]